MPIPEFPPVINTCLPSILQTTGELYCLSPPGRAPATRLTAEDVKALVASLQDITAMLAAPDRANKAKAYAEMGIDITYQQDGQAAVESWPLVVDSGVGEAFRSRTTRVAALATSFSIS